MQLTGPSSGFACVLAAWWVVLLTSCAGGGSRALPAKLELGEPFDFALPRLDGTTVRSADLRGNVVLVDVWATWCAPCEKSFPFYARLVDELGPSGFQVVAVSVDERAQDVKAWLEGRDLPFVIVHDPEGTIPERIGLRTMPSAVLLDREGRVTDVHAGFEAGEAPDIERKVRLALGARP